MSDETKISRTELLGKIREIIKDTTNEPADEMIALGEVMVRIGKALKPLSVHDQRATMRAVLALNEDVR